ncbi:MAG: hypothetical protein WBA31_03605 [Candidatus Dormiibacterota bacterium]
MTLDLDTRAALRGISDIRRLVNAILAASPTDETDWLEWKSGLNLGTREGCFAVARTVLGMANRMPEDAARACEGVGYVVVGAEPGNLNGVESVDSAITDQIMEQYLGGADGPRWAPVDIVVEGDKHVFVVTVEPPRAADKIFTLRREFGPDTNGRVFVRKRGRTVPANAADMDALQRRLTSVVSASSADLRVGFVETDPMTWFDAQAVHKALEKWADDRVQEYMDRAKLVERSRHPSTRSSSGLGPAIFGEVVALAALQQADAFSAVIGERDTRTFDQYAAQLNEWRTSLLRAAFLQFIDQYTTAGHGRVALRLENRGGRFLSDVEVRVSLNLESATFREDMVDAPELPLPPRALGERKPPPSLLGSHLALAGLGQLAVPDLSRIHRRTWVEDEPPGVRFAAGNLRQLSNDTSAEVYLLVGARPSNGVIQGEWTATVRDMDGVVTGTVELPVSEEPVDSDPLLKAVTNPERDLDADS